MNGFVPNYIEEIKRRLDIVEVISAKVPLKKAGKNYKGLCPFHSERSGSFFVWPQTESYYCFGCHASGDIFSFVMQTEGLDFGETLTQLAARAGVILPERTAPEKEADAKADNKARLSEANAAAATYFTHLLLNSQEGQVARDYLAKRGIGKEAVESFGLGYSLDSWDALTNHLTGKNRFTHEELLEAGLIGQNEAGDRYYDRFRGRLIFPIRDRQGQVIAFGGRILTDAKDTPKYLNSPQTPLFDKSATLYGFDLARDTIRRKDQAVIVEGYVDVIAAHQAGFSNVVAPLGTALGEKHVNILKKLTKRIVLALDADTAGQMATLKGIEVMKQGFDTRVIPVPTARGLVKFEQTVDADIRIATLPEGKDPDEVIAQGGGIWRTLIERAQPIIDYYFASVAASVDLNSAKGKSEAVEQLAAAIVEVRDRIARESYIQKLARLVRLDVEPIRTVVKQAERREGFAKPKSAASDDDTAQDDDETIPSVASLLQIGARRELEAEDRLLAFLWRYPDGFGVEGANGKRVEASDFTRSENRQIFEKLVAAEQDKRPQSDIENDLEPELSRHLEALKTEVGREPELPDLYSVQQAMSFQLNRVRELNLRSWYEQGSAALEDDLANEADQDSSLEVWQHIANVGGQLKIYYPKPSAVFKDSRDR